MGMESGGGGGYLICKSMTLMLYFHELKYFSFSVCNLFIMIKHLFYNTCNCVCESCKVKSVQDTITDVRYCNGHEVMFNSMKH